MPRCKQCKEVHHRVQRLELISTEPTLQIPSSPSTLGAAALAGALLLAWPVYEVSSWIPAGRPWVVYLLVVLAALVALLFLTLHLESPAKRILRKAQLENILDDTREELAELVNSETRPYEDYREYPPVKEFMERAEAALRQHGG